MLHIVFYLHGHRYFFYLSLVHVSEGCRKLCFSCFHAKTARTCLIISCTLLSGFLYLAIHISTCLALYIVLALASISLMINSPIVSPQRPATLDEQKHFRHVVIAAMILYNSIILLLSCTGFSHWAVCLALGLILSAALQIPCIISKMKTS